MYRIFLALTLLPFASAFAVTPFVSVGMAPMVSIATNEHHNLEGFNVETLFFSYAGNATAGVRTSRFEWFARYVWSNSYATSEYTTSYEFAPTYDTTYRNYEINRLKERKLLLGGHWVIAQDHNNRVRSYVGGGLMAGISEWNVRLKTEARTFYYEDQTRVSEEISNYVYTLDSGYDYGGFVELGAVLKVYQMLFVEFQTQGEIHHSTITDWDMEDSPENEGSYLIVEPSFSLGLRWDIRLPKSHN